MCGPCLNCDSIKTAVKKKCGGWRDNQENVNTDGIFANVHELLSF